MDLKFLSERTPRSGALLEDMMNGTELSAPPASAGQSPESGAGTSPAPTSYLPDALMTLFRGILQPGVTSNDVLTTLAKTQKQAGKPEDFPSKLTGF